MVASLWVQSAMADVKVVSTTMPGTAYCPSGYVVTSCIGKQTTWDSNPYGFSQITNVAPATNPTYCSSINSSAGEGGGGGVILVCAKVCN